MVGLEGLLELFGRWDCTGVPITSGEMRRGLGRLKLGPEDVAEYALFSDVAYQRVLIHSVPSYQALILGWRSGQRSPIHDHGGSVCGVYLVSGIATETIFRSSPCGRLVPARSRSQGAGAFCVSRDADIHQMANLEPPGHDLITLHVYSPPLTAMRTYSLNDTTLADHDSLAASRPMLRTAEVRLDPVHSPFRNHSARSKQVTS